MSGPVPPCEAGQECNPVNGQCGDLPDAPLSTFCETDVDLCTSQHCDGNGQCVPLDSVVCPDPICQTCNPQSGICEDNGTCRPATCRTPGFWGTHARANPRKPGSQNITQAVINAGGGSLLVCGECINATVPVNNAASSVEATCVSPRGAIALQNARQLTAMALNCIVSGFGADCGGDANLSGLFSDCNNACLGLASTRTNTQCRDEIDCFNNGGQFNSIPGYCQTGTCANGDACNASTPCADLSPCTALPDNCHDQPLVNADLGLNFDPPGPAGSEADCNTAIGNHCAVLPFSCSATKGEGEACCGSDSCP